MRGPIYEPAGAAREYAELALNLYTGCPHGCSYCYVPGIVRKRRDRFSDDVRPRAGILAALDRQLSRGGFGGRTVHLCFTCDPYPAGCDDEVTRDAIVLLKAAGCHVQVLTKNPLGARRDLALLGDGDVFGVTLTGHDHLDEPGANPETVRMRELAAAHRRGLFTWVSAEPIADPGYVLHLVEDFPWIDRISIGRDRRVADDVDWASFVWSMGAACRARGVDLRVKDSIGRMLGEVA